MKAAEKSSGTVILGPHRSGTSLITRLIAGMGRDLGGDLIPAAEDNPKGYWEHRGVVETHDSFLRAIGRSWSDPLPLEQSVFSGEEAAVARGRIEEIFENDFRDKRQWALKDPRLCRLLPLWDEVLNSKGVSVDFVHVVRSPIAAAASLEKRDGMRLEASLLLWLRHMIEVERSTRGHRRLWIELESIETDPVAQASRLAAWLDEDSDETGRDVEALIALVFDPGLLHNDPNPDDPTLNDYPWVAEVYRELSSWTAVEDPSRHGVLDRVLAEISTADRLMIGHPLVAHQSSQREERLKLREEIEDFHQSLTTMRTEVATHRQETDHLRSLIGELQHLVARVETKHAELLSRSLDMTTEIENRYLKQTKELREIQKEAQHLETDLGILHTAHDVLSDEYRRVVEYGADFEEEIRNKDLEIDQAGRHIADLEEEIRNKDLGIDQAGRHIADLEEEIRNKEQNMSQAGRLIADLEETIRNKDLEIDQAGRHIADLEEEIHNKDLGIDQAGRHIADLEEEIRNKDLGIDQAGRHIADLEEEIHNKDLGIDQAGRHIADLEETTRNKDLEIDQARRHIADLEEEIRNKDLGIDQARRHIADFEETICNKDLEIDQAGRHIAGLGIIIGQATREKAALDAEQARLHGLIDQLEEELGRSQEACGSTLEALDAMTNQLSWRMTAPLRSIRRLLPSKRNRHGAEVERPD